MTPFRVTGPVGQHELYTAITGLMYDLHYLTPEKPSAISARYVTKGTAQRSPNTTVAENG